MSPALLSALAVACCLALLTLFRTLRVPKPKPCADLNSEALSPYAGAEGRLAALVRVATVSHFDKAMEDPEAFSHFRAALFAAYPLSASRLLWAEVGPRAILGEWPGSDASLPPSILCAHYDVVPAGEEAAWSFPPFAGDVADGYVRGRGSQDTKVTLSGIMEACERLLALGFTPKRTVYLAFGGDEETGGLEGAARIADLLRSRGVKAGFLLDEGGVVARGIIGFAKRPVALVGISEKGYVDVAVEAAGVAGHAAMPPRHTAAGVVSKAVKAVEDHPFPTAMTYTLKGFLNALSPYVSPAYRWLFSNLFLTSPLVRRALAASQSTNALVRTTAAATMLSASDKENVLPRKARAVFNVRILPGGTVGQALARIERLASRHGARASFAHHGHANEPLPESPLDHEGYRAIELALGKAHPEAACVPFLFMAATDTKHYRSVAEAMYRLTPISQDAKELAGIHGVDERVSVENARRCCLFYESLIASL